MRKFEDLFLDALADAYYADSKLAKLAPEQCNAAAKTDEDMCMAA